MKPFPIEKRYFNYCAYHEIVNFGDEVCPFWGMDALLLTKKELESIANGKVLWVEINGGEYSLVVAAKDEEKTDG